MDSGTLSGIVTVVFVIVFIGIVWWAFSRGNKQRFEEDGKLPFDEDDSQGTPSLRDRMPAQQGDKQ
ncbi:MAG: cbb3-type cytochrome C oxidase subunit 3 [Hydrogenophilales bacterium 16-62-9]|nr:MAG: cbb3-type cytochrome C oxidase subunit 3 [Hydrogenophilales bacterium 16-62-9]OZA12694.1 MAG: cbb3-type cytochrome C oxidase subunit 3 [Hydrogenophilales bacterium 17-62-8]